MEREIHKVVVVAFWSIVAIVATIDFTILGVAIAQGIKKRASLK